MRRRCIPKATVVSPSLAEEAMLGGKLGPCAMHLGKAMHTGGMK